MELHRIETPGIAHYAYLLADGGEAALVDPRRDVDAYLQLARERGVRIRFVLETHRQEDFVMGSAHLAARTGASIVNQDHALFGHGDLRLRDGDFFRLGSLTLRAVATPGHTPESVCYVVYPDHGDEDAWAVFSGDALFFGDTGRTDLTDPARTAEHAADLYDAIHARLAPLADTALVLPAHGPGSVCGSGMQDRPVSTLGEEKRANRVFTLDRDAFARHKAAERLPRPPYFRHMEEVNLAGGLPPAVGAGDVPLLGPRELAGRVGDGRVIDTREPEAFAGGHVEGSTNVWLGGLPVFGGWVAEPDTPVYLVTRDDRDVDEAALQLSRIGLDGVRGALAGGFGSWRRSGLPIGTASVITPRALDKRLGVFQVLDVREIAEFEDGHIPGARHTYVGHLESRLPEIPLDGERPLAVTCSVGHRAGLAVSLLRSRGFTNARNLLGGMTAWRRLGLPETR